jgi:hypothetical protein
VRPARPPAAVPRAGLTRRARPAAALCAPAGRPWFRRPRRRRRGRSPAQGLTCQTTGSPPGRHRSRPPGSGGAPAVGRREVARARAASGGVGVPQQGARARPAAALQQQRRAHTHCQLGRRPPPGAARRRARRLPAARGQALTWRPRRWGLYLVMMSMQAPLRSSHRSSGSSLGLSNLRGVAALVRALLLCLSSTDRRRHRRRRAAAVAARGTRPVALAGGGACWGRPHLMLKLMTLISVVIVAGGPRPACSKERRARAGRVPVSGGRCCWGRNPFTGGAARGSLPAFHPVHADGCMGAAAGRPSAAAPGAGTPLAACAPLRGAQGPWPCPRRRACTAQGGWLGVDHFADPVAGSASCVGCARCGTHQWRCREAAVGGCVVCPSIGSAADRLLYVVYGAGTRAAMDHGAQCVLVTRPSNPPHPGSPSSEKGRGCNKIHLMYP